jgi:hypothetical protein
MAERLETTVRGWVTSEALSSWPLVEVLSPIKKVAPPRPSFACRLVSGPREAYLPLQWPSHVNIMSWQISGSSTKGMCGVDAEL